MGATDAGLKSRRGIVDARSAGSVYGIANRRIGWLMDYRQILEPCPECGLIVCDCAESGRESETTLLWQRDRYREALIAIMGASSLRKAWEIAQKGLEK